MPESKGFDIKIGLDTSEVSGQLADFKNALKSTEKELKNVNANLKLNPKSITDLTAKSRLLKDAVKNVTSQLSLQEKELNKARKLLSKGALEGGEAAFDALQKKVNATKEQLAYFNGELQRTQDRLKEVKKEKWEAVGDLGHALSGVSKAITAAAAALVAFVSVGVNSLTQLSDAAATAGMTAEQYQRLAAAANALGVSTENATKGVEKIQSVMTSLAAGTGANYEKALKKIGLSYKDIQKMSPEDAFKAISDALKNCEDETTALYVAQQIFGEQLANKIMPLIMAGSESINELEDSAVVASNESVDAAKRISGSISRIKSAFTALAGNIAQKVEPLIQKMTSWVESSMLPTLQKVVDGFFALDEGTQKLIVGIVAATAALGPLLVAIGKIGTGASSVMKIFASGKVGLIVSAIIAVIALLIKLYKENERFREAVKAVVEILKNAFSKILAKIGETLKRLAPTIEKIVELLAEALSEILEALGPILGKILEVICDILPVICEIIEELLPVLVPILKIVVEFIKVIAKVLAAIWEILKPIFELIGKLFQKIGEWLEESGFGEWLEGICEGLATFCGWIAEGINNVLKWFGILDDGSGEDSGFLKWLKDVAAFFVKIIEAVKQAIENVKEFFGLVGEKIGEGWDNVTNWFQDTAANIVGWFADVGNAIGATAQSAWDGFTSWLSSWTGGWKKGATGGVVKGATPMIVGEAGAEAIMPLERNTGWLSKMAAMIVQAMPQYLAQQPMLAAASPTNNNTYNVTINTTASSMSIREIDEALGGGIK